MVCVLTADSRLLDPYRRPAAYTRAYSAYTTRAESERAYRSATVLHNFYWARRHGYRFIAANATAPTDWAGFWAKLPAIIDTARRCEWTVRRRDLARLTRQVFFDGDAFVTEPSMSLSEMLQRWGFHDRASLLFGESPQRGVSNFGFGIVRRTEVAIDALERTLRCPIDDPECAHLKTDLYHDQSAFVDFIAPTLRSGVDYISAPCLEANGAWCMVRRCRSASLTAQDLPEFSEDDSAIDPKRWQVGQ